jgi:uncharacterized protein (DUF983 family)
MKNRSLLNAIVEGRCPQCRETKMFKNNMLSFSFHQMHKECSSCGLFFEVEPGFFFGAMYVSYAMVVGLFIVIGLLLNYVFGDPNLIIYMVSLPVATILMLPFIFRYSRILFLYMFGGVSYKKEAGRTKI